MAESRLCSISDCGKPAKHCGLCNSHYRRSLRHGDPSKGRTPRGAAPAFLRDVVLQYDGDDCLIWPFARSKQGYAHVRINQKTLIVPRLVCEATNGPAPDDAPHAAHECGNGRSGCVSPKHLSWKSIQDNNADKVAHDSIPYGERCSHAKLSEADVAAIRSALGSMTQRAIAARFGVSEQTISGIKSGRCWRHQRPA